METKKHLFGSSEKSDFIVNMTQEGARKLLGMFSIIAMWVLGICALPYYLTKDSVKNIETLSGIEVTHYYTENTIAIMSSALIAVGFFGLLMFLIASIKKEATLRNKKGLLTLGVVILFSLISMFSSEKLRTAFFGHSYRNDGFLIFLASCCFVFIGMLLTDEKWRRRFCDNLVALGAFEAAFGIAQCIYPKMPNFFNELFKGFYSGITDLKVDDHGYLWSKHPCATGLLCSPQALAAVLTVIFAFAAAGVMYAKSTRRRLFYLAACALMAVASILTHILSGYIGIPCVLGVLLVIEIIRIARKNVLWSKRLFENALVGCILAIAVTVSAFVGLKIGGELKLYDEDVIFTETFVRLSTSYHNRAISDLTMYDDLRHKGVSAINFELDHGKVFGVGQDCTDVLFGDVTGLRTDRIYNDYLDFIIQRGIITFVTYCIFLLYALYNGVKATIAFYEKKQPFYGAAAFAGTIGYLVVMFWNTSSNTSTYYLYLCIGMMIMYGQKKALSPKEKKQAARKKAAAKNK